PSPLPRRGNELGFTLAEVLITLVIIGVIAAITVPTLMNNTNNQEYVSKLKKAYSTLAQATNLIIAEEGTPKASVGGWTKDNDEMYNLYKKHLLNSKDCGPNSDCFSTGIYKYPTGHSSDYTGSWNTDEYRKLVLSDGTQVIFQFARDESWKNCTFSSHGSNNYCARIFVDINGERKPNQIGKDYFGFVIKENGLYPYGCDYEGYCPGGGGLGCACKVLREGAINY
ncbi:type II secretion system protein, partial [bacterium]|nr:type II secretion system protein [bacterium]